MNTATQNVALLYRINVAEAKLGVSRSTIYRLVKEGKQDLVKIGKRSSGITASSIFAMIEPGIQATDTIAKKQQADALTCGRSEEHTSELQSLMRSSYAVFCLKKKKK